MGVSKKKSGKAPQRATDSEKVPAVENTDAHAADMPDVKLDSKTAKIVKKKLSKLKVTKGSSNAQKERTIPQVDPEATVVYLGHLPFGFYEAQIKGFLSQFGDVGRLRVSRSPKTARTRGFAFIEFFHREVAEIVVDTMHNYLLFGKLLKCHIVEKEKVHPEIWKNADKKFRRIPRDKIAATRHNKVYTEDEVQARAHALCVKENALKRKLASLDIDYSFPGYSVGGTVKPTKKRKQKRANDADVASDSAPAEKEASNETGSTSDTKKSKKRGKENSNAKSSAKSDTVKHELPQETPKAKKGKKLPADPAVKRTPRVARAEKKVIAPTPKTKKSTDKNTTAAAKKTPRAPAAAKEVVAATPKAKKSVKIRKTASQTPGPSKPDAATEVPSSSSKTPKANPKAAKSAGRAKTPAAKTGLVETPKGKTSARRSAPASSAKKISRKKTRSKTKVALSEEGAFVSPVRSVTSTASTAPPSSKKKKRMQ
eukprot:m.1481205 g.1481205  ORF g.1481205 m.1481205 type:complete len:484 (-) comp25174_c0_seq5:4306-5757(-)